MGISASGINKIKLVAMLPVSLLCVFLALSSLTVSSCISSNYFCDSAEPTILMALYIDSNSFAKRKLTNEYKNSIDDFEFMTWPKERKNLAKRLLDVQHQRINLDPSNANHWLNLNFLNREAKVRPEDHSWGMKRSVIVAGWRHEYRASLIYYCVIDASSFSINDPDLCREVLLDLPNGWSLAQIARKANINTGELKQAIDKVETVSKAGK